MWKALRAYTIYPFNSSLSFLICIFCLKLDNCYYIDHVAGLILNALQFYINGAFNSPTSAERLHPPPDFMERETNAQGD